jgi:uncharacterized tellurite resistance protein B-like protein
MTDQDPTAELKAHSREQLLRHTWELAQAGGELDDEE